MIKPLLESINNYLRKTQDLSATGHLATEIHASARAQGVLSRDITEIKNIFATPVGKAAAPAYAQTLKDLYILKPTTQTRPSMGTRSL
jgi:hypothetical protein